jgi:thiamine pyrophosphokinase
MLYNFFKKIDLKIISDQFTIECIAGENVFNSFKGQRVSLFTQNTNCIITTKKLKYSINGQIEPSLNLISNESVDDQFIISSSRPIILFRSHKEK